MAKSTKIQVMISSRCKDLFPPASATDTQSLTEIRKSLKAEIENLKVFDKPIFEVWINEDAPPAPGNHDSWEQCLEQVRNCDVMIVLSNGNAGWAKSGGDVGICHAEYMEGLNIASGKVWLVSLGNVATGTTDERQRNKRFQDFVSLQSPFRGGEVKTIAELKTRVKEALRDSLVTLTQRGVLEAGSSRFDMGQALDWSRMDFRQRKSEMEKVLRSALVQRAGAKSVGDAVLATIASTNVLMVPHGIPASLSVASARELVGRPFLLDHERVGSLKKTAAGPVHIIACQKTATETQATNLLGFPDATVVSAPFGVYVADNVQKVQFAFLVNCRDDARTRHAVQRFFEWLEQTGEDALLASRAVSRAKIVSAIATEFNKP